MARPSSQPFRDPREVVSEYHGDYRRLKNAREIPLPALAVAITRRQSDILDLAARHGDVLNRLCGERRWDLVAILLSGGAVWNRPVSGNHVRPRCTNNMRKTPLAVAVRQHDPQLLTVLGASWTSLHTETLILAARFRSIRLGNALWAMNPPASALERVPPQTLFWNQVWLDNWIKARPTWAGALVFRANDWIGPGGWVPPAPLAAGRASAASDLSPESWVIPDRSVAPNDPVARALPMFDRLAKLCGPSVVRRPQPRHGGRPGVSRASVDWLSLVAGVLARGDVGKARALARTHALPPVALTQVALALMTVDDQLDLREYVGAIPEGSGPARAALRFLEWSAPRVSSDAWNRAWGTAADRRTILFRLDPDDTPEDRPFPVEPLSPSFALLFQRNAALAYEVLELFREAGCPLPIIKAGLGTRFPELTKDLEIMIDRDLLRRAAGLATGSRPKAPRADAPTAAPVTPRRRAL